MINTLLGIKKGMTSSYDTRGRRVGATLIEISPNFVTQVKSSEGSDGYNSIQIGAFSKKSVRKPQQGHFKKAGAPETTRFLREIRTEETQDIRPGQQLIASQVFLKGDLVEVNGVSKGKGFQGGVRRHGFHGGPKTHGQSDRHRAPGSIGAGTTPGRVYKGKRMAGHMGVDTVTTKGLEVISVDKTTNMLVLKGAVPGSTGSLVTLTKYGHVQGHTPEESEESEESENSEELGSVQNDSDTSERLEKSEESEVSEETSDVILGSEAENEVTPESSEEVSEISEESENSEKSEAAPVEDSGEPKEEVKNA